MDSLSALGLGLLILAAANGIAVWVFLVVHGVRRLRILLEIGRDLEFMKREPDWDKDWKGRK